MPLPPPLTHRKNLRVGAPALISFSNVADIVYDPYQPVLGANHVAAHRVSSCCSVARTCCQNPVWCCATKLNEQDSRTRRRRRVVAEESWCVTIQSKQAMYECLLWCHLWHPVPTVKPGEEGRCVNNRQDYSKRFEPILWDQPDDLVHVRVELLLEHQLPGLTTT